VFPSSNCSRHLVVGVDQYHVVTHSRCLRLRTSLSQRVVCALQLFAMSRSLAPCYHFPHPLLMRTYVVFLTIDPCASCGRGEVLRFTVVPGPCRQDRQRTSVMYLATIFCLNEECVVVLKKSSLSVELFFLFSLLLVTNIFFACSNTLRSP